MWAHAALFAMEIPSSRLAFKTELKKKKTMRPRPVTMLWRCSGVVPQSLPAPHDQPNQRPKQSSFPGAHRSCRLLLHCLFEVALAAACIPGPRSILFCNHHKVLRLVVRSSSTARHVTALLFLARVGSTVEFVAVVPGLDL